jgi:hypothetical protein
MAKTTKNDVVKSLRKTMIDVIDELELDAVIDAITELDALERVGGRNDGN